VNVFVGPNNCGKTTALTALGTITACLFELPAKLYRPATAEFAVRFTISRGEITELRGTLPIDPASVESLAAWESMLKALGYTAFVPALRQSTSFRALGPLAPLAADHSARHAPQTPAQEISPWETAALPDELRRRRSLSPTSAGLMRDEVAIESLVDLHSRAYRWNDPALHAIIAQVATMASEITDGFPMQFLRIAEDQNGLFPQFRTPDGDVPFNVLSQGTQSVMQWLTYLLVGYARYYGYPANLAEQPGVVIVDEIDAHLHPAAQRRVIPTLQRHFPRLQIFCSTHSPLMLAGLQPRQMQLLSRDSSGKVTVSRNETDIVGWSADEILRGFLGVEHPTDVESDRRIGRLQALRQLPALSPAEAAELEALRHSIPQTRLGARLPGLAELPSTPVEPSAAAPIPKAKAPRPSRAKRATGKASATSTTRRASRTK
jgi:hypothetical protein